MHGFFSGGGAAAGISGCSSGLLHSPRSRNPTPKSGLRKAKPRCAPITVFTAGCSCPSALYGGRSRRPGPPLGGGALRQRRDFSRQPEAGVAAMDVGELLSYQVGLGLYLGEGAWSGEGGDACCSCEASAGGADGSCSPAEPEEAVGAAGGTARHEKRGRGRRGGGAGVQAVQKLFPGGFGGGAGIAWWSPIHGQPRKGGRGPPPPRAPLPRRLKHPNGSGAQDPGRDPSPNRPRPLFN